MQPDTRRAPHEYPRCVSRGPRPMTRAQIDALPYMPPRFTGVYRGKHYYLGNEWTGATNAVGVRS